jgi:hypothetical protein
MRKIPEFLPPTIQVFNNRYANVLGGAVGVGNNVCTTSHVVAPTQVTTPSAKADGFSQHAHPYIRPR